MTDIATSETVRAHGVALTDAVHMQVVDRQRMGADERLAECVERAGADIAEDDADGTDRELHLRGRALLTR